MAPTDLFDVQKSPTSELERIDPVHHYQQRVRNLSDETQLIKLSTDVGFVTIIAFGQFLYRGTLKNTQLEAILDVENIPYLETIYPLNRKAGFVKVRKLVLYLDVNINYHQGKPGTEIRIGSLSRDNAQSLVKNFRTESTSS